MIHLTYRALACGALLGLALAAAGSMQALRARPGQGTPTATAATGAGSAGCGHAWPGGTDSSGTLPFGGLQRTYLLHVPPSYNPATPWPLILNLPGTGENGIEQAVLSHMSRTANTMHALIVYPDGTQSPTTWNTGFGAASGVDDVGFLSALVHTLEGELCVDISRVAATGISIGAFMDYYLACRGVPWLSAIAPVAGTMPMPQQHCRTAHRTPLIAFNGVRDTLVPYQGYGRLGQSIPQVVATWARAQGCPRTGYTGFSRGDVVETVYARCPGGTETDLYAVTDGGHAWPGGFGLPIFGKVTQVIDASSLIIGFVERYPQA